MEKRSDPERLEPIPLPAFGTDAVVSGDTTSSDV